MRSYSRRVLGTLVERLEAKIAFSDGCWTWTAALSGRGYGVIRWAGRNHLAHRMVYIVLVGPIPAGMDLDHTCENTACVNPAHLEPVADAENKRRQAERRRTCKARLHPWAESRVRRGAGWRCGKCERLGQQRRAGRS